MIRWSYDCFIYMMGIPVHRRTVFILKWIPCSWSREKCVNTSRSSDIFMFVNKPTHHYFREWFVNCLVPSHYLNQCSYCQLELWEKNFDKIWNKMQQFSFKKMLFTKWQPFCLGLTVLMYVGMRIWVDHVGRAMNSELWLYVMTCAPEVWRSLWKICGLVNTWKT